MKKINNYWVDEKGNRWNSSYTEKEALENSESLINCFNCTDCNHCVDCRTCTNCFLCVSCRLCENCENCEFCEKCINFTNNPQRYVSRRIGSRKSQTIIYWDNYKTQVNCGCFTGTLEEFHKKVNETYPNMNNKHRREYYIFITTCKLLIEL